MALRYCSVKYSFGAKNRQYVAERNDAGAAFRVVVVVPMHHALARRRRVVKRFEGPARGHSRTLQGKGEF